MRYSVVFFIFIAIVVSCKQSRNSNARSDVLQKKEESGREPYLFKVDTNHVDEFFSDIEELKLVSSLDSVVFVQKSKIRLKIDSTNFYDIVFSNIKDWDDVDPGDFRRIDFIKKTEKITILELDGWVKAPQKFTTISDFFLYENLGLMHPVVILIGYPYASDPPFLTIIGFDDESPKVVYNKKRNLVNIQNNELIVVDANGKYSRIYGLFDRIQIR